MAETFRTSPLLFGYRGANGSLAFCDARTGARFRLTSTRAAELVQSFLESRPAEDGDFTREELEQAREAGIISPDGDSADLWEESGWSLPAFLLFSQMDREYAEFAGGVQGRSEMAGARGRVVDEYRSQETPPEWHPLAEGPSTALPDSEADVQLASFTTRRSVRAFSPTPPSAEQLAGTLYTATETIRMASKFREGPESHRTLNSAFTWGHLYVVVQTVEGVDPGVYEYDPHEHRLIAAAPAPDPDDLVACVQGQRWILGAGFVVFLVAAFRPYAWLYRTSRSYLHVLEQTGEMNQGLLLAATALGLVGWTTPAVYESRTATMLGLPSDDDVDVISMVKLALPRGSGSAAAA